MLVRFKKAVSVRSVGSKINQRSYASLPRGAGGKNLFPNTPVLNKVLSDTGAQKTLAESYADAVASQKKLRDDLLREVNTIFGSSPYASVRSAAGELTGAIAQLDSALPANLAEASFRADNLDELLQVHEVSELYSAYAKAFAQLTPPENKTVNPKVIAEEFAPALAEVKVFQDTIARLKVQAVIEQEKVNSKATNLMYIQADDMLAEHPEIEAQIDEEIVQNRWDLLAKDEHA